MARALEFIWSEAADRTIQVPDVVRLLGGSRRFAEIHFKNVVGRTIMEEVCHRALQNQPLVGGSKPATSGVE